MFSEKDCFPYRDHNIFNRIKIRNLNINSFLVIMNGFNYNKDAMNLPDST